jgi:cysteinyl-tRNA synthetase
MDDLKTRRAIAHWREVVRHTREKSRQDRARCQALEDRLEDAYTLIGELQHRIQVYERQMLRDTQRLTQALDERDKATLALAKDRLQLVKEAVSWDS